jgi:uncharacterized repeat protein (TIGR03803 family)
MARLSAWKMAGAALLLCAATVIAASAQTFETLVNFDGSDGSNPFYMSLVQGADGSFYGTTLGGGTNEHGTVFQVSQGGTLTTLHSFHDTDGQAPYAGLVLGVGMEFFGTTAYGGGNDGAGTVFKVSAGGALTTLHLFDGTHGFEPWGALLRTTTANMFGTTYAGGANNAGTIFRIDPSGVFATEYSFCAQPDCTDGANPLGGLLQATDGSLYGTTGGGGASGNHGTVFRFNPEGTLETLHSFDGADGAGPYSGLIQAADGVFYGTTPRGGANDDGTIFKITAKGTLTTQHVFEASDGAFPFGPLIQGTDGNFYGMTILGGDLTCSAPNGCGTVFKMTPSGGLTTLHYFEGNDGTDPYGGLLQATNGMFYGTAELGGNLACSPPNGCGTVFSLDMGLGPFVTFVRAAGKVGQTGGILGQGFTGTTSVSLNGTPVSFTVISDTFIRATVPVGATTGFVTVTTPSGTLTSNVPFHVIP